MVGRYLMRSGVMASGPNALPSLYFCHGKSQFMMSEILFNYLFGLDFFVYPHVPFICLFSVYCIGTRDIICFGRVVDMFLPIVN